MIEMSGDAMCGQHGFLSLTSKLRLTVSSGLASKPVATDFPIWASKPTATVW
jgi:hypothetical protein